MVITALVNQSQIIQIIREINHLITLVIEVDHQNKEICEISHKVDIVDQIVKIISIETTIHVQIQTEGNFHLIPIPIQILGIDTTQTIDHEIHHTIEIANNRNKSYSNNRNRRYQNRRSRNYSYNRSSYQRTNNKYYNRSRNNSQNRNPNYNNQQLNYSQPPDSQHQYRSNTPKHQRQINQVQATEETTSDPLVSTIQKVTNYN